MFPCGARVESPGTAYMVGMRWTIANADDLWDYGVQSVKCEVRAVAI